MKLHLLASLLILALPALGQPRTALTPQSQQHEEDRQRQQLARQQQEIQRLQVEQRRARCEDTAVIVIYPPLRQPPTVAQRFAAAPTATTGNDQLDRYVRRVMADPLLSQEAKTRLVDRALRGVE